MTTSDFWQSVDARLAQGEPVFIAIVAAATRGSPGTPGARLLLGQDGNMLGTIGGGIMERKLLEEARTRLAAGPAPPQLVRQVHRKNAPDASGLICAGQQHNLSAVLDPQRDREPVRQFCRALDDQNAPCHTLTITAAGLECSEAGPDPAGALRLEQSGDDWRYCEESVHRRRLLIIGGGHCGKALARLAGEVGYHVDVFDTRAAVFDGSDWPAAVMRHVPASYAEVADAIRYPAFTRAVVMTTAVDSDIESLAALAPLELPWLGVMGSRAKIDHIHKTLAAQGMPDAQRKRIHGPIGLEMKSDTPPEIAVSIMAQLLAAEPRATEGESARRRQTGHNAR